MTWCPNERPHEPLPWLTVAKGAASLAGMWLVGLAVVTVAIGGTVLWWERPVLPMLAWMTR